MTTEIIALRAGLRLRSQVCTAEAIVIRPGADGLVIHCGGLPMVERDRRVVSDATPVEGQLDGALLGKRYTHPADAGVEVLVTVAGVGTLSDGAAALVLKDAKPLPASD